LFKLDLLFRRIIPTPNNAGKVKVDAKIWFLEQRELAVSCNFVTFLLSSCSYNTQALSVDLRAARGNLAVMLSMISAARTNRLELQLAELQVNERTFHISQANDHMSLVQMISSQDRSLRDVSNVSPLL